MFNKHDTPAKVVWPVDGRGAGGVSSLARAGEKGEGVGAERERGAKARGERAVREGEGGGVREGEGLWLGIGDGEG